MEELPARPKPKYTASIKGRGWQGKARPLSRSKEGRELGRGIAPIRKD